MILQALSRNYERLIDRQEPGLSPMGYSPEKISYAILLNPDGTVAQVQDIRDTSGKKPLPRPLNVPQPEKRTVGIKPNVLWDKTSYVLGCSATSKRSDKEHEAFKASHLEALTDETDEGLVALRNFLQSWAPDQFKPPLFNTDMLDSNMVFRLAGDELRYLHDRPAAQMLRARLSTAQTDDVLEGACLVTGDRLPLARLHPPIKGVYGAQSSGASLVSFNLDAFASYGKTQGENAPISELAAFAYTTVLNHLLRRGDHNRQRLQIGDATVVFWAEAPSNAEASAAESLFSDALEPPDDEQEAEKVRRALEAVAKGRPLRDIDPQLHEDTRMYVLGLSPNASRLSIRFWEVNTLGRLVENLARHEKDLRIEPTPWKKAPSAWRLALATAPSRDGRAKSDDVSPQLAGELMRSILTGNRYPGNLLSNVVMRMRSDGDLSGVRVAICKGVLSRNHVPSEEIPVSLDKQSINPAYLLGRLFAMLEYAQRSALGGQINATIRDRYYGAASATPASIFPMLLRNTQNHMGRLRKDKPGLAVSLERDIRDIVGGLPSSFPRSLPLEEQGRFAIGYYHQAQARFTKGEPTASIDAQESPDQGASE
ncbi:MAG: type I-C CRISPR-associated protein Cas8c/Csd1 [Ramlibacter sp.]|nr:type I-C CRISPR-associated protein Cas8c/Csd1 [Ramlibacter sp.]